VPFLLGTTSFGFSHEQIDSVCLAPEDPDMKYDAATIADCHTKAQAFATLQSKTAAFAASLQVLDASRIRFEAGTWAATQEFRRIITEQGQQTLDDASRSEKINALKGLFRTALADVLGSNSNLKNTLHRDAETVRERTTDLNIALDDVIPQMEAFMSTCNMMTTGVGPSNEYLLDMCSQTSRECLDAEEASHVGCCCGYNPVVTLGTSGISAQQTINGLGAATFANAGEATRVGTRRLQQGASSAIDICAQAFATSGPEVQAHYAEIRSLGQEHLIAAAQETYDEQYPEADQSAICSEWDCNAVPASRRRGGGGGNGESDSSSVPQRFSMVVLVALVSLVLP
jgi:hypothetical protein